MNEILNCIKQNNQPAQACDLVKMAADFSLQSTSNLARRVLEEFQLSEEQRWVSALPLNSNDCFHFFAILLFLINMLLYCSL